MRSKEVSKAIDKLTIAQNNLLEATLYSQEEQDEDIKTVLSYIEELEKEIERIKSIDIYKLIEDVDTGQLIHKDKIRDKIKELETYKFTSSKQCKKAYEDRIKDLKSIIGE